MHAKLLLHHQPSERSFGRPEHNPSFPPQHEPAHFSLEQPTTLDGFQHVLGHTVRKLKSRQQSKKAKKKSNKTSSETGIIKNIEIGVTYIWLMTLARRLKRSPVSLDIERG
jgi:hypothetical protein